MRQNAEPILALAEFKRLISAIKYQELMPDPFDSCHPVCWYEREHRLHLNRAHRLHPHIDTWLPSVAQGLLSQRSA